MTMFSELVPTKERIGGAADLIHNNLKYLPVIVACWQTHLCQGTLSLDNVLGNIFACHEACLPKRDPSPSVVSAAFSGALPRVWHHIVRNEHYLNTPLPDRLRNFTTKLWPDLCMFSHIVPTLLNILNSGEPVPLESIQFANPTLPADHTTTFPATSELVRAYDAVSDIPRRCALAAPRLVDLTSAIEAAPRAQPGATVAALLSPPEIAAIEACRVESRVLGDASDVLTAQRDALAQRLDEVAATRRTNAAAVAPIRDHMRAARAIARIRGSN